MNIAKKLLDDIFERDEPCCSTEFVDDDGDVNVFALKIFENRIDVIRFGHEIRFANERTDDDLVARCVVVAKLKVFAD